MTRFTHLFAAGLLVAVASAASAATRHQRFEPHAPSFRTTPPAPVSVFADSADSLYRAARKALDDGSYQRAADLFQRIVDTYPDSRYTPDALYWRAFALYRRGGTDDLHDALDALAQQEREHPAAATHGDAGALATRIRGELARRGDRVAAESVSATARNAEQACPSDDDDIRVAALNAVMQMDADQALPILRKVLARRDRCSEPLRKKAIFIVAQQGRDDGANILLDVVRNDPSADVRGQAVFWLGQVQGDRAVSLLDSILEHATDDEIQQKAIFALSQHDSPKAREVLRDLIQRPNTSEEVKSRAIFALGHFSGRSDDMTYLRDLYPKLTSERLKEQVIQSVAQGNSAESRQWLTNIALDDHENIDLRKKALFWGGQNGAPVAELAKMYDGMRNQELKEQLIFVLSQNRDRAATDKLMDIARHDADHDLRKKAVFWLGQRDDPRVRQFLEELINNDAP
jgi:TolA-binding protein